MKKMENSPGIRLFRGTMYALNAYPRAVVRAAQIHHFKFDIDIGNDKL